MKKITTAGAESSPTLGPSQSPLWETLETYARADRSSRCKLSM